MFYGHDHGGYKAYIREKTSQRVTRYDIYGNVISTCDSTHVDGVTRNQEQTNQKPTNSLKNLGNGKYLGRDGQPSFWGDDSDLNLMDTPQSLNIVTRSEEDALYGIHITRNGKTKMFPAVPEGTCLSRITHHQRTTRKTDTGSMWTILKEIQPQ